MLWRIQADTWDVGHVSANRPCSAPAPAMQVVPGRRGVLVGRFNLSGGFLSIVRCYYCSCCGSRGDPGPRFALFLTRASV